MRVIVPGWMVAIWLGLASALPLAGEGESACMGCHTASSDTAVHAIFRSVHGSDGAGSCIGCHGASEAHTGNPVRAAPDTSFGPQHPSAPEQREQACLACHEGGERMHWASSVHRDEGLACDGCHRAHVQQDPMLTADGQDTCLGCHAQVRAQLHLPSRHPIAEGKTGCGDCHNAHGGSGEHDLLQPTLNDNCYSCHAETRGPFLFEHPPVAEDCGHCHVPHGSVNARLLSARTPFLCQQCHSAAFHPSQPYGGQGVAGVAPNRNLLGKDCLNCHGQVHGSNHPSGARLTR